MACTDVILTTVAAGILGVIIPARVKLSSTAVIVITHGLDAVGVGVIPVSLWPRCIPLTAASAERSVGSVMVVLRLAILSILAEIVVSVSSRHGSIGR